MCVDDGTTECMGGDGMRGMEFVYEGKEPEEYDEKEQQEVMQQVARLFSAPPSYLIDGGYFADGGSTPFFYCGYFITHCGTSIRCGSV